MDPSRHLVILGAGTAGSIVANKLSAKLSKEWRITVVAENDIHDYKPGYLFVVFDMDTPKETRKTAHAFIPTRANLTFGKVESLDPDQKRVELSTGETLDYDALVIATGAHIRPDQTEGMLGDEWHKSVGEFYSLEGATALRDRLATWKGGRLVMHISEMPIMCPVAPLEFVLLADDFLRKQGTRDATDIVYVTPLDGAFTKPVASSILGDTLTERGITVEPDFAIDHVDQEGKKIVSFDEREIAYDQLVTVPVNMGADFVTEAGLGDDLGFVVVDKHTNQNPTYPDIWSVGDAASLPTSKAGAVAHFSIDIFVENFLQYPAGKPLAHSFDGHANCFVESGNGKALLLDFNYDTEPLVGTFPFPGVGPLSLLKESRFNHIGKRAFRWIYWNLLIKGRPIFLPAPMMKWGKKYPKQDSSAPAAPTPNTNGTPSTGGSDSTPVIPTF